MLHKPVPLAPLIRQEDMACVLPPLLPLPIRVLTAAVLLHIFLRFTIVVG